jgi:hypothetical protein
MAGLDGCATGGQVLTNDVPGFDQVEQGIYRGGQPASAKGWAWLQSAGVSNVVKLNLLEEGTDAPAAALGMRVQYFPIDTMQQLVTGPDAAGVSNAVAAIGPGTFVHCLHGEDRTGLVGNTNIVSTNSLARAAAVVR